MSRLVSRICRIAAIPCSSTRRLPLPSLYFQWAAIPCSATRSISRVRIWISNGGSPSGITVVCRDW